MALLQDEDLQFLKESFAELEQPVTLTLVARERSRLVLPGAGPPDEQGDATQELEQLIAEIAAAAPEKIVVARSEPLPGELTPALTFSSAGARGKLRYVGLPAGYEMSTLVGAIMDLGAGEALVPPEITARLDALPRQVHVQVFVTPS